MSCLDVFQDAFSESDLPYMVDVLDWSRVDEDFRKIMERGYLGLQPKLYWEANRQARNPELSARDDES